jgi:hypothetical protein
MAHARAARGLGGIGALCVVLACAGREPPPFAVGVPLRASVEGSGAAALVLVVDVPGVPTRRRIELPVRAGRVVGVVPMEPGRGRIVSAHAQDAHGVVTHAGERAVDVREDAATAFTLDLAPRAGRARITLAFGTGDATAAASP